MNPLTSSFLIAATGLLLSSCQSGLPEPEPGQASALAPSSWASSAGSVTPTRWISTLGSPQLETLVQEAQQRNFGLEAASQRSRAAAAAARISKSLRIPSLNASLRSSKSQNMANFAPPVAVETDNHSLGLSARWEIDLWNRLGSEAASAVAQYRASQYELEAFELSLAGQVARSWFSAIEARLQYELAKASAQSFERNLEALEKRYSRGLIDAFDLRLTRSQAAASRATALSRRQQMDATLRTLETLLGRYPSAELELAIAMPKLIPPPAAGIPSDILSNRPDILAEKNRLISALALEQSANRNWLPSLALTASDGTLSNSFSDLLDRDFNVWSIAGDLSVALFQGGRLEAQREQFNANQLSQLANYNEVVLQAFREVETALRGESNLHELEVATTISAEESEQAEQQAWQLYERGLVDITAVLDAERRAFGAKSQLISIQNQRLQNRINLHIALGDEL
ncbi:efflux transporter outer membrane subunit [Pelagicoccus sp. SDUM812002]|uniref:efflux transporter outer membrane subunit n=1 Tax=Pelagicoccus sp. SDUM812002 TaxID=3041266 RepID=UPI00280DA8C3|nr:efflux transporter outer membrane subunit [Pelagicoccus sp. SDUM812002]MDQ8185041.1 efflux transporter outer membrane subunit [Pelagicoccus sp. SDUM812002]